MSDLIKAAEEIGKLTKMFDALQSVKPHLQRLGSLDQAQAEAQKSLAVTAKELAALKSEQDDARKAVAKAKDEAAAVIASAKSTAATIAAVAAADADAIKKEAMALREGAAGVLAFEQSRAQGELTSLQSKVKAATAELADIERRTESAKDTLRKLAAV